MQAQVTVFGCLFAQSKRRKSSNVDKVEELLFIPFSQTVDAKACMHEELKGLVIHHNTALNSTVRSVFRGGKHCAIPPPPLFDFAF